jgi:hypothetical protein
MQGSILIHLLFPYETRLWPFRAELTGYCYATSIVMFYDIFVNEPNKVFDNIF